MKVVVLGSHGFLGSNLTSFLNEDFEVVGLNRENLDLNDEQEIKKVLMGINPNYVLLAAGKVGGIGANLNNNFLLCLELPLCMTKCLLSLFFDKKKRLHRQYKLYHY